MITVSFLHSFPQATLLSISDLRHKHLYNCALHVGISHLLPRVLRCTACLVKLLLQGSFWHSQECKHHVGPLTSIIHLVLTDVIIPHFTDEETKAKRLNLPWIM